MAQQRLELFEAVSTATLQKIGLLITKYVTKKSGVKTFRYPGVEIYKNSNGRGAGIRFYTPTGKSFRFNYKTAGLVGMNHLHSMTYWGSYKANPYEITFAKEVSLSQVLPIIAEIIRNGAIEVKNMRVLPNDVPLNESFLTEKAFLTEAVSLDPSDMFDDILQMIQEPTFAKGKIHSKYKSAGFKLFDALESRFSDVIIKQGTKYTWDGNKRDIARIKREKESILDEIGAVSARVARYAGKEIYAVDKETATASEDLARLSFEDQLKDMENLLKLTVSGASNAIFVAGRGGVGKTHTVEKVLHSLGLRDGTGYFKNTGTASAAGIYSLLFRYKNDVILFDDSDGALSDQNSRNIIKAATDTKKVRKLVWNTRGPNIVDQDEDMTDEEILDAGKLPRTFEFTGRIIFISNLSMDKLDPDGALRTRAFMIDINPTEKEIYDFMEKIAPTMKIEEGLYLSDKDRKHVVDLLRNGNSKQSPNLRKLQRGLNMLAGCQAANVEVSDAELARMISSYA